jgi:hypothetical protein
MTHVSAALDPRQLAFPFAQDYLSPRQGMSSQIRTTRWPMPAETVRTSDGEEGRRTTIDCAEVLSKAA